MVGICLMGFCGGPVVVDICLMGFCGGLVVVDGGWV